MTQALPVWQELPLKFPSSFSRKAMVGYCQSQILNEEKSLLCFSTHSFQNNRFHSLICDFCTIFVWDLIKVYVQYNVSISAAEDVQSWASREGLSDKIVQVLAEEGFASLDDIKDLSSDEVTEGFHRSKLLNFKKCRDLRKAIARMSLGDSTDAPLSRSAPSASSPTGRSFPAAAPQYDHGRDQLDFRSTTSVCDESGGNLQCC